MPKIVIVEDDRILARGLGAALRHEGYEIFSYETGEQGLSGIIEERPDAALLDMMLPEMSGFELITELRRRGNTVPILVLSARDATRDKVRGLDLGADDYLTKPFELDELLARLRRLLARAHATLHRFADFIYEPQIPRLTREGEEIFLTPREHGVLKLLLSRRGRTSTREEILENVWGGNFEGNDRTVDNCIFNLRKKMGQGLIVTVRSGGYRICDEKVKT